MLLRLKIVLVVSCLWTALSCAADNYDINPAAQVVLMSWLWRRALTANN